MKSIVIFLALITMFFYAKAQNNDKADSDGPKIEFKKTIHDFGNVIKGSEAKCEFVFTNTGNEPLFLSDVKASCDCTVPSWPKAPVLPGGKGTITVAYDTEKVGVISKEITVISNAVNPLMVLRITGNVVE